MADLDGVVNNRERGRFELKHDGTLAVAEYRLRDGAVVFTHTVVPPRIGGQGVASALIGGALEQVRADGGKVVSHCSFVTAYLDRHPETQDLLATAP